VTSAGALPAGASQVSGDEARLVSVRRAEAADREALARMFDRCTPQTRYRRFHGPIKAIPGRYLADALSGSTFHYALVACLEPAPASAADLAPFAGPDVRAGEIIALASCRMVDEGAAELGLLVEDAWQRHGLGTRLLGDLVGQASRAGLRVLQAQVLAEQAWITGLLRPYGTCHLRSTSAGVLNVTVRLDS
jgi:GNAT superfamily N-acetyltransferase